VSEFVDVGRTVAVAGIGVEEGRTALAGSSVMVLIGGSSVGIFAGAAGEVQAAARNAISNAVSSTLFLFKEFSRLQMVLGEGGKVSPHRINIAQENITHG
jgi:hypothetical protein